MTRKANRTGRDADPRRTLKLNGSAWQKLRASVLAEDPLCRMCAARGVMTLATDVDHISGDPSDNSRENLQPLCHSCHSTKTARDHGKGASLGCDLTGMPLDPLHPWNVASRGCAQAVDPSAQRKSRGVECPRPPGSSYVNADCENQP